MLILLYFVEISNTLYVCSSCSHEYQIFQKVVRLEYEFPDGFPVHAKDLVTKLLVIWYVIFLDIFKTESGRDFALFVLCEVIKLFQTGRLPFATAFIAISEVQPSCSSFKSSGMQGSLIILLFNALMLLYDKITQHRKFICAANTESIISHSTLTWSNYIKIGWLTNYWTLMTITITYSRNV